MQIFGELTISSAVSLPRYAQLIGYSECAFFGVSHDDNVKFACREIWSKSQRDEILEYLKEAQEALENVLDYPLQPIWIESERHKPRDILLSKWGKVIEPGIKAETVLSDGVVSDLGTVGSDPDVIKIEFISPEAITDLSEVHIFYPDTDLEIIPSNIEYDSLTQELTIYVPRCRMVKYDKLDNPEEGWVYTDDSNFQSTVDVHRIYTDSSVQAKLFYRNELCVSDCSEDYSDECIYVDDPTIGKLRINSKGNCCKQYSRIEINYKAGVEKLTRTMESMIIRLAHSMMPTEPCGCDMAQKLWMRDRDIPKILTRERIECPFGMSDGAWAAWKWASGIRLIRMSTTVGKYSP